MAKTVLFKGFYFSFYRDMLNARLYLVLEMVASQMLSLATKGS